jgi:hypothetical protein
MAEDQQLREALRLSEEAEMSAEYWVRHDRVEAITKAIRAAMATLRANGGNIPDPVGSRRDTVFERDLETWMRDPEFRAGYETARAALDDALADAALSPPPESGEWWLPPEFVGFLVGELLRLGVTESPRQAQATARDIIERWNGTA